MILAFDTSTAACTAALFDGSGTCIASKDELIGRGHSERLVPMIAELLEGRPADEILVGVGPGSFTGIRVAIAAAHGMAIGWSAKLRGFSSIALIAAGIECESEAGVAIVGGHGELFVQQFGKDGRPLSELYNLAATAAAAVTTAQLVVGSGSRQLVEARGWGEAREAWPSATNVMRLPDDLRQLSARPVYARAPDARAMEPA